MNDHSAEISARIRDAVSRKFPGCFVTTGSVSGTGATLPALRLEWSFPEPLARTVDTSGYERWTHTKLVAEAYSGTSFEEANGIIQAMDEALGLLGFTRSNWTRVPDADASIRRVSATWRASVSADGQIAAW